jgi:hypothetical protein
VSPAFLDLVVHPHQTGDHQDLGIAPRIRKSGQLDELAQSDRKVDRYGGRARHGLRDRALVVQTNGHDQIHEVITGALDEAGAQRTYEPKVDGRLLDGGHAGL